MTVRHALLLALLAACNANLTGKEAPALAGDWVGGAAPAGEWKVLSFFAPG